MKFSMRGLLRALWTFANVCWQLYSTLLCVLCYGDLQGVTCWDKSVLIVRQKAQCHDLWWQGYFHSVTPPIDGNPPRNLRPRNDRAGSNCFLSFPHKTQYERCYLTALHINFFPINIRIWNWDSRWHFEGHDIRYKSLFRIHLILESSG